MNRAITALTIALLTTLPTSAAPPATTRPAATPSAPTDAQLRSAIKTRLPKLGPDAAVVIGWVDEKGPRVIAEGKAPAASPLNGDSLFEIGSATKAFTGLLLADMVTKNEVSLDDPVAKYLPPSVHVPERAGKKITLLDLATHTSALPRLPENMAPKDPANPYADYTPDQLYAFLAKYELPRDIGADFEYSNLGMGLLGHALALKSHTTYESLVKQRICTPLKMSDTTITLSPAQRDRLVPGHDDAGQPVANWDLPTLAGAGALRSSANDMLKFVAANVGLTDTPLRPAIALSHEPRHPAGSPALQVGLAWHVFTFADAPLVWHNGQTAGYHSVILLDPARKRGLVLLANTAADLDELAMRFLLPKSPSTPPAAAKQRVAIHLPVEKLDQYVGTYRLTKDAEFTVKREDDQLLVMLTGQSFLPMFPESETNFFLKVVNAQITFKKTPTGKIKSLTLHQNGLNQEAPRE
jgi:D-alanyl-D-alanine-carboxypeptidase/D-alanyl-D-alanine-endopeptidase